MLHGWRKSRLIRRLFRTNDWRSSVSVIPHGCEHSSSRLMSSSSSSSCTRNTTAVFTWGSGNEGQLGHGVFKKEGIRNAYEELLPRRVEAFDGINVRKLACGQLHTAAVDSEGRMYTFGDAQYGKLGLGESAPGGIVNVPTIVEAVAGIKMVDVDCGEFHTLALDDQGRVYSCGWGGSFLSGIGALGLGDSSSYSTPTIIQSLVDDGVQMAQVQGGELHSIALSDDGEVWGWGNGEYGRQGSGDNASLKLPDPLEFFADMNCKAIAAGHSFSLALTEEGNVFTWGRNDHGQLGLGGGLAMDVYSMENYPRQIKGLAGVKIAGIAAGNTHAAAFSEEGELFVWGSKTWLEPNYMSALKEYKVVAVGCGTNYTAIVSDKGELFTFGKGRSNCLAHNDRKTKLQPELVTSLSSEYAVKQVACGSQHMGVVAELRNAGTDRDFSMRD